ncbi:hypothetical protein Syun_016370 [Stephania yunnanensis]|uniref:Glabrous enhancer-binding protein-like DBD domain-containing protein n=1 Tax=Stephania yunnanensis TaxID=152371 RepID=A0AAP0J522_9MAGN
MQESKQQRQDRKSSSKTRRQRIMRQLGLSPPIGSPFAPSNDDKKRRVCQRVFSEQDKIHLLQTILSMRGVSGSPSKISMSALFDRVGDSLSCVITLSQLRNKVSHLRHIYEKQVSTNAQFKNPHEQEVFEVSHKIWGGEVANIGCANDGSSSMAPTKERSTGDLEKKYPHLMEEASRLPATAKSGLGRLSSLESERLNERWRAQQIEEAKVLSKRGELIQEINSLILEAIEVQQE